jgi:hypothetical protein
MAVWFKRTNNASIMKVDLNPNEMVVKAGDSNFCNGAITKGKLVLTNQRIFFTAQDGEIWREHLQIHPSEIREVMPYGKGLFSARGLSIITRTGNSFNFTLSDREAWTRLINKMY